MNLPRALTPSKWGAVLSGNAYSSLGTDTGVGRWRRVYDIHAAMPSLGQAYCSRYAMGSVLAAVT